MSWILCDCWRETLKRNHQLKNWRIVACDLTMLLQSSILSHIVLPCFRKREFTMFSIIHYSKSTRFQKIHPNTPAPIVSTETLYDIVALLDSRSRKGKIQYFIDWAGSGPEDLTLIVLENPNEFSEHNPTPYLLSPFLFIPFPSSWVFSSPRIRTKELLSEFKEGYLLPNTFG